MLIKCRGWVTPHDKKDMYLTRGGETPPLHFIILPLKVQALPALFLLGLC